MDTVDLWIDFEIDRVQVFVGEVVELSFINNGATLVRSLVGKIVSAGNIGLDFEIDDTIITGDLFEGKALVAATIGMLATVLTVVQVNYCFSLPAILVINDFYIVLIKRLFSLEI